MNFPVDAGAKVDHETIAATTGLDQLIFSDEAFSLPLEEQQRLREMHVRGAFVHHLEGCAPYASFAGHRGVEGLGIHLDAIPVVPTAAFKDRALLSVPPEDIAKLCLSSGTRGVQSRVARDRNSLERLLGSVRAGVGLIESWYEDEVEVLHLGPDRQEAGGIWFPYLMSLIELLHPTQHCVSAGAFDAHGTVGRLAALLDRPGGRHAAVVGPPFRVMELVQAALGHGPRIVAGDRLTVVTGGGWKRFSGAEIGPDAFRAQVCAAFGLAAASQVRDVFNQVELNTVFMECSAHRKHVPPWVYATTRDPDTLSVQAMGQVGLLSYLDASATSYPAMLVTDDIGRVAEGLCPCGRNGVTMEVHRRLARVSARGCALALDSRGSAQGCGA